MKSAFAIACVAAVSTVDASFLDSTKEFIAEFPVTRSQALAKYG
jgi:hypothetical protein